MCVCICDDFERDSEKEETKRDPCLPEISNARLSGKYSMQGIRLFTALLILLTVIKSNFSFVVVFFCFLNTVCRLDWLDSQSNLCLCFRDFSQRQLQKCTEIHYCTR